MDILNATHLFNNEVFGAIDLRNFVPFFREKEVRT